MRVGWISIHTSACMRIGIARLIEMLQSLQQSVVRHAICGIQSARRYFWCLNTPYI